MMKISIVFFVLLGGCFAQHYGMMGDHLPMMHHSFMSQMMSNPFEAPPKSEFEQLLSTCLARLTQSVEVVIDVNSHRADANRRDDPFSPWWPFAGWHPTPLGNYDVAEFVDTLSKNIPKQNLYAVVIDGELGSQTKYYLNAPVPEEPMTTSTTPAPITRVERVNQNGVSIMRYFYHQSYSAPPQQQLPTLRELVSNALFSRTINRPIEAPMRKESSAPNTMFTVVITDSSQKTPLNSGNSDRTIILDVGGKLAASEPYYTTRNLLVVPDFGSLNKFSQAVQFMICQAAGGNIYAKQNNVKNEIKVNQETPVF